MLLLISRNRLSELSSNWLTSRGNVIVQASQVCAQPSAAFEHTHRYQDDKFERYLKIERNHLKLILTNIFFGLKIFGGKFRLLQYFLFATRLKRNFRLASAAGPHSPFPTCTKGERTIHRSSRTAGWGLGCRFETYDACRCMWRRREEGRGWPWYDRWRNWSKINQRFASLTQQTLIKPSHFANNADVPWSSLVKGGEQLDRPKSQTIMELCHACVA